MVRGLGPIARWLSTLCVVVLAIACLAVPSGVALAASPPDLSVSFGAASIPLNGSTSLSFEIGNPNQSAGLVGLSFTDSLPRGLVIANHAGVSADCGGQMTATPGASTVTLSGASVSAGAFCEISVTVTGRWGGKKDDPVTVSSSGATGNTSTASVTVVTPLSDRVYFTNATGGISFANLDGSGGGDLFTGSATVDLPVGLAVDLAAGRIYWANNGGNKISFANLDGSGSDDLSTGSATVSFPVGGAVDSAAERIYWANGDVSKISFANLDGSGGGDLATGSATLKQPAGVAVDPAAGRIYWANHGANKVSFAHLDGSGGRDLDTAGATVSSPFGVAVDPVGERVYWANEGMNTVSFARLDGSGGGDLNTAGATVHSPEGVAVDPGGGRIYWANYLAKAISFANVDGSGGGDLAAFSETGNAAVALLRAPIATATPTIAGGSMPGSLLSCSEGTWAADLTGSFLYRAPQGFACRWSLNGSDIAGATASSLVATAPGDYRCRVNASNFVGSTDQTSAPRGVVAPPPSCQPVTATTAIGQPVVVVLSCSDPVPAALSYSLDSIPAHGALSAFSALAGEVTYTPAAGYSGPDSFIYHATTGNVTAPAQTVSITVTPTASAPPPAITNPRTAPAITDANMTNKRFRVAPRPTAISARKAPRGTSFRFTLSTAARLHITITRSAPGLLSGRRCLPPTRKLNAAHPKRCPRTLPVGTLTRTNEPRGENIVPFSGRIGHRTLTPGVYRALLIASNANGTSPSATLGFVVVP